MDANRLTKLREWTKLCQTRSAQEEALLETKSKIKKLEDDSLWIGSVKGIIRKKEKKDEIEQPNPPQEAQAKALPAVAAKDSQESSLRKRVNSGSISHKFDAKKNRVEDAH